MFRLVVIFLDKKIPAITDKMFKKSVVMFFNSLKKYVGRWSCPAGGASSLRLRWTNCRGALMDPAGANTERR